ncbi:MAG: AhpC/TSA family protein [Chitinophagaceae bacterium]|nr:AhpC/TSA family protein [Chitinophagaceae bacterium]
MKQLLILLFTLFAVSTTFAQQKPKGLALHAKAPNIEATDQNGNNISLAALRKEGPVVVLFYRGNWCPYCNKQLKELQDSLQHITAKGAAVIAITPEAQEGVGNTIEKTGAAFPIISDKDVAIGRAYNVSYEVDTATLNKYKTTWDVDFLKINEQKEKAYLPVPAVYIIDKKGLVTYRFFDTDATRRPSVKELLANLK